MVGGWTIDGKMGEYILEENGQFHFDINWDENGEPDGYISHLGLILLDPKAWAAVGKTRGWDKETAFTTLNHDNVLIGEDAAFLKNREFLEHLWDGKTIEEALKAISE